MRGNIKNTLSNLSKKKSQVLRPVSTPKTLTSSGLGKSQGSNHPKTLIFLKLQRYSSTSSSTSITPPSSSKVPNSAPPISKPTHSASKNLSAQAQSFSTHAAAKKHYQPQHQYQQSQYHQPHQQPQQQFYSSHNFQQPYYHDYQFSYDPQVFYYTPVITYYPIYYPITVEQQQLQQQQQQLQQQQQQQQQHQNPPDPRAYSTTPVYAHKSSSRPNFQAFTEKRKFSTSLNMELKKQEEEFDEFNDDHSESSELSTKITIDDIFLMIQTQLNQHHAAKISWINRMLTKVQSLDDWHKAFYILNQYIERALETTPETGTLFIKAACRAGAAEEALKALKDVENFRLFPTLGGIHYLMINFSLQKGQTSNVISAFSLCEARSVVPTTRTYHILIRECVDNGLLKDAMVFANASIEKGIAPSRVAFNILMNGCRQAGNYQQILNYRNDMSKFKLDINDTTVKFTVVAYLMLGDLDAAVKEFKSYPELDTKLTSFCSRFLELLPDHEKELFQLFERLQNEGLDLPDQVKEKMKTKEPLDDTKDEKEEKE